MRSPSPLPRTSETKVEGLARRLKKARRTVLKEATDEYVARHDAMAVTEAMNRVADAIDTRPDPGLAAAARSIIEHTEW